MSVSKETGPKPKAPIVRAGENAKDPFESSSEDPAPVGLRAVLLTVSKIKMFSFWRTDGTYKEVRGYFRLLYITYIEFEDIVKRNGGSLRRDMGCYYGGCAPLHCVRSAASVRKKLFTRE
jgi:hypothetical protein